MASIDHEHLADKAERIYDSAPEGFQEKTERARAVQGVERELYSDLEAQIGAMSAGFVAGRASAGTQDTTDTDVVKLISSQFCSHCLADWIAFKNGCCLHHVLDDLLKICLGDGVSIIEVEHPTAPHGASLN